MIDFIANQSLPSYVAHRIIMATVTDNI